VLMPAVGIAGAVAPTRAGSGPRHASGLRSRPRLAACRHAARPLHQCPSQNLITGASAVRRCSNQAVIVADWAGEEGGSWRSFVTESDVTLRVPAQRAAYVRSEAADGLRMTPRRIGCSGRQSPVPPPHRELLMLGGRGRVENEGFRRARAVGPGVRSSRARWPGGEVPGSRAVGRPRGLHPPRVP
jgi:hypothetical protein